MTSREERAKEVYMLILNHKCEIPKEAPDGYKELHYLKISKNNKKGVLKIADYCISKEVDLLRIIKLNYRALKDEHFIDFIDQKIKERDID